MTEEQFSQLIKTADTGVHRDLEIIYSYEMLCAAELAHSAVKKTIRLFKRLASAAKKNYEAGAQQSDVTQSLLDYKTFVNCRKFYQKEAKILKYMLDEYFCYTTHGHFISMVLLNQRPEANRYDYLARYRPWRTL